MNGPHGNSNPTDSQIRPGNESPEPAGSPASDAERLAALQREVEALERSMARGIPRLDRRLDAIEAEVALLREREQPEAPPRPGVASSPPPDVAGLEDQLRGVERRFDHAFRELRERSLLGRVILVTALVVLFILVLRK